MSQNTQLERHIYTHREFFLKTTTFYDLLFTLYFKHFHLPVALGAGHDWLDSGCPKTDVNDLSSTNALLVFVVNPLLVQLLIAGVDMLSIGTFVCDPATGAENMSAKGLLN